MADEANLNGADGCRRVNISHSDYSVLNRGNCAPYIIFYDHIRDKSGIADEYGDIILEFPGRQLEWGEDSYFGQFAIVGETLYIVKNQNEYIKCDAQSSIPTEIDVLESGRLEFDKDEMQISHLFADGSCYFNIEDCPGTYLYNIKSGKARLLKISVPISFANNWCAQIGKNGATLHLAKARNSVEPVDALIYENFALYDYLGAMDDCGVCDEDIWRSGLFGVVRDGVIECLDSPYGKIPIQNTELHRALCVPNKEDAVRRGEFVRMGTRADGLASERYNGPKGEEFAIWEYEAFVFANCVLLLKRAEGGVRRYCIKFNQPIYNYRRRELAGFEMRMFGAIRADNMVYFAFAMVQKGFGGRDDLVVTCKFDLRKSGDTDAGVGEVYSCIEFATTNNTRVQKFPYCYQMDEYHCYHPVRCGPDYHDFAVRLRDINYALAYASKYQYNTDECYYHFVLGELEDGSAQVIVDMNRGRVVTLQRDMRMGWLRHIVGCFVERYFDGTKYLEGHVYCCSDSSSNIWAFYDDGRIVPFKISGCPERVTKGYKKLSTLQNAVIRAMKLDSKEMWGFKVAY